MIDIVLILNLKIKPRQSNKLKNFKPTPCRWFRKLTLACRNMFQSLDNIFWNTYQDLKKYVFGLKITSCKNNVLIRCYFCLEPQHLEKALLSNTSFPTFCFSRLRLILIRIPLMTTKHMTQRLYYGFTQILTSLLEKIIYCNSKI